MADVFAIVECLSSIPCKFFTTIVAYSLNFEVLPSSDFPAFYTISFEEGVEL